MSKVTLSGAAMKHQADSMIAYIRSVGDGENASWIDDKLYVKKIFADEALLLNTISGCIAVRDQESSVYSRLEIERATYDIIKLYGGSNFDLSLAEFVDIMKGGAGV